MLHGQLHTAIIYYFLLKYSLYERLILPEGVFSPADIFENARRASGKFGGVAGVLHGVICKIKKRTIIAEKIFAARN